MAGDSPSPSAASEPAPTCPKCGAKRSPAVDSCARCGLVFALWNPEAAAAIARLDETAEGLWRAVTADWADRGVHDAFLKYCSQAGLLPAAGRRYRERRDADPHDTLAQEMQNRVLQMATALMGVPAKAAGRPVTRSGMFWVVLLLSLVVGATAAMLIRR